MGKTLLHRKDSIVITSIEIISELGVQGLTSKEIAKREKISEGTLFSHFKNMNEIISDVLKYHSELDASIVETVEAKNLSPTEAITLFASIYAENYENYPESSCLIDISGMLLQYEELTKQAEETINNRIAYFKSLIEKAQKCGEINSLIDSQILIDIVVGSFLMIVHRWRKSKYTFKFKQQIIITLKVFLDSFKGC
ncbi:TetR/AcrR family transcriptional regulator [Clostridium chromiireducens]|uniref:DNA-binding transcriptional regulator EnvR n=1 Tax=Clostridium chromiireducens TaxID=225345 RepID=A0A1V4IR47_9CLOT|nr:TetR/AcrR family transcriptional regulator [Clostridium chromiireducens]MVX67446.1 TetR family transcriptional regulator [Clostridium chromiireducens]OPJ62492.1 DNA-binding transcriptional regulator EnvR [Clostridium chromiireducens]